MHHYFKTTIDWDNPYQFGTLFHLLGFIHKCQHHDTRQQMAN